MKKLIIVALAVAAATTMYAQGTFNMASSKTAVVTYGTSCGDLAGLKIGDSFTGTLMYEGQAVGSEPFTVNSKGVGTGKMKATDVSSNPLVPAGTSVNFTLHAEDISGAYKGDSALFAYTTGDANDPTKLPDAELNYDAFTVEYIVPEPTTIALGILGLSSLLVFRRRD